MTLEKQDRSSGGGRMRLKTKEAVVKHPCGHCETIEYIPTIKPYVGICWCKRLEENGNS